MNRLNFIRLLLAAPLAAKVALAKPAPKPDLLVVRGKIMQADPVNPNPCHPYHSGPYDKFIEIPPPSDHPVSWSWWPGKGPYSSYSYRQACMAYGVYFTDPTTKQVYVLKNRGGKIGWMSRARLEKYMLYAKIGAIGAHPL